MQEIFLPNQWQMAHFPLKIESRVKRGSGSRVLNQSFYRFPKVSSLQSFRPQCVHRSARFVQTAPRQFAGALQMRVRLLASATRDGVLDCFQLHDYAGETLRERVVNVARQAISFLQNGRLPASLGEFIELNCEHRLVSECLRQLDLLRPIGRPVAVPNPDEPSHTAAHEGWNSQELFRSSS